MNRPTSKLIRQSTLGFSQESGLMGHVDLAEEFSVSVLGKNLAQKNSGKFYTPQSIAIPLIRQALIAAQLKTRTGKVRIIDPFCGDGRLIAWTVPLLKGLDLDIELHLWDYDVSVTSAATWVRETAKKAGVPVTVISKKTDSFSEFFKDAEESFDLVITNPPWEVVKPDSKDLQHITDEEKKGRYILSLKDFSDRLTRDFPLSRPSKTYGGWGVSLARVGTELSVRLAKQKGIVALVTPATIFADQSSCDLREWLFAENTLRHLNVYPAELKLFAGVDQPSVSFVLKRETVKSALHISHYQNLDRPVSTKVSDLRKLLESTGNILPVSIVANSGHMEILSAFAKYPQLSDLEEFENLWIGRELDETNYKVWTSEAGSNRFIKGRDISRFNLSEEAPIFVNGNTASSKIPESVRFHRIVWRDISRPNQKRRVIATMIPPGSVAGNSLGVLHVAREEKDQTLLALLGLVSSYMFEFQLRAYLATAHVSAGVLKKIRIPEWNSDLTGRISKLVTQRLNGTEPAENEIEIRIAQAYGFTREQFAEILEAFPKVSSSEKADLLASSLWK